MSASQQIKLLHDLQLVDLEIMEIEKFRDSSPNLIKQLEEELKEHRKAVEQRELALKEILDSRRKKEKELEEHESRIEKNKTRMMAVKTNEEYHAIQKENDAQAKFIEELEDQVLRLMDDIEGAELAVRKAKDRFAEMEKKVKAKVQGVNDRLVEIEKQLVERNARRDEILPLLEGNYLARYTKLRKMTGGVAVVRVKNRTCQGCLMNVSPQTYNMVIRNEEVITCPNCYRILYYEEDTKTPAPQNGAQA